MRRKRRGCPSVRVVMFPKDTNPSLRIFGGTILSNIDIAGVTAVRKICSHRFVTVSFEEVDFKKPVHVGDVLTCWSEVTRVGKTSITTQIRVDVERNGSYIPVTEGTVVYVAVDDEDNPIAIESGITRYGRQLRSRLVAEAAAAGSTGATTLEPTKDDVIRSKRRGCPAVRIVMFPKDTNPSNRIFGGVILSHIDVAGVTAARKICSHRFVTVNFKKVVFKKPVHVGDVLTCWVEITRIGTTSLTAHIQVDVERDGKYIPVTVGTVVYVAVDNDDNPLPIDSGLTRHGRQLRRKLAEAPSTDSADSSARPKGEGKVVHRRGGCGGGCG